MTDPNQTRQVSAQELLSLATGTTFGRSVLALVIGFIGLLMPFVGYSTNLGLGADQSGSLSGFQAAGWAAWLMVIVFVAAAASWKIVQLAPYRLILAGAALVTAVLAVIVGWFFNPATQQLGELQSALGPLAAQGNLLHLGPHIGMVVVLIAGALHGWTAWNTRRAAVIM